MEKYEKKFYAENELISTPYYKKYKLTDLLVGSDIHYHPNVPKEIYRILVDHVRETKPDFVIMPGDIVETIDFIDDSKEKNFFERVIKDLAEVAPVIIVPGNHEIGYFGSAKDRLAMTSSGGRVSNSKSIRYFESLNNLKNVYFLNNEQTEINGMMFLGFNPRLATYLKKGDAETNEMLIEDYLKSGLKMATDNYNVLLTHCPLALTEPMVFNSVLDFQTLTDLVITGHFHDGYLPKKLDKYLGKTNAGLFFTPLIAPLPGIICRGVHDFGRGYLFVSQGFRKWTADIGLFNAFEKITANDVEHLMITNPELIINEKKGFRR